MVQGIRASPLAFVDGQVSRLADAVEQVEQVRSNDLPVAQQIEYPNEIVLWSRQESYLSARLVSEKLRKLTEFDERSAGILEEIAFRKGGVADEKRMVNC